MAEAKEPGYSPNSYVLNPEDATEIARLDERYQFFKKAMQGPLPERNHLHGMHHILDIGCGPAGWALDIAGTAKDLHVVGIDISATMIGYASSRAKKQRLTNIEFRIMDARKTLDFQDRHFDLINMHSASEYIPRDNWPQLLEECQRILRPGSILRLMEVERVGQTNSPAFERYHLLWCKLLQQSGHSFTPEGYPPITAYHLKKLLQNEGYKSIHTKTYRLDFSYGTALYKDYIRIAELLFKHMHPYLLKEGLATQEELITIYSDLLNETRRETFRGTIYPLIIWSET